MVTSSEFDSLEPIEDAVQQQPEQPEQSEQPVKKVQEKWTKWEKVLKSNVVKTEKPKEMNFSRSEESKSFVEEEKVSVH